MNTRTLTMIAGAVLLGAGAGANADVLWEQLPGPRADTPGVANWVSFPGFNAVEAYAVDDVHVGPGGWTINSVSTWYTADFGTGFGLSITSALLHIAPISGGPSHDPSAIGTTVAVTAAADGEGVIITASGLDIDLAEGDYWVGLTALNVPVGFFGPDEFGMGTGVVGDETYIYDNGFAPGWFSTTDFYGAPIDIALRIEGVPAPGALALLGLGGLGITRRRR